MLDNFLDIGTGELNIPDLVPNGSFVYLLYSNYEPFLEFTLG